MAGASDSWQLRGCRPARPHTNRSGGYRRGDFLRVCDRSGKVYLASDTRKEWNGLIVGRDEWEPRHPQEFKRGIREKIASPEPRPARPFDADTAKTISNITAVSGSVVAGVYTSGAATETRPFVFWKLDLGSSVEIERVTMTGLALSGSPNDLIRRGLYIQYSTDDVTYTSVSTSVNQFGNGVDGSGSTYVQDVSETGRYVRLALVGGKGFGYTGTLTMTGVTVDKAV